MSKGKLGYDWYHLLREAWVIRGIPSPRHVRPKCWMMKYSTMVSTRYFILGWRDPFISSFAMGFGSLRRSFIKASVYSSSRHQSKPLLTSLTSSWWFESWTLGREGTSRGAMFWWLQNVPSPRNWPMYCCVVSSCLSPENHRRKQAEKSVNSLVMRAPATEVVYRGIIPSQGSVLLPWLGMMDSK